MDDEEGEGWVFVKLPKRMVERLEAYRKKKLERRPGNIPLGLFVADLMINIIDREKLLEDYPSPLEIYLVEESAVHIRDNQSGKVIEVTIDSSGELRCCEEGSHNCIHVGYALSVPSVNKIISQRRKKQERVSSG